MGGTHWLWAACALLCLVGAVSYLLRDEGPTGGRSLIWSEEFDSPIAWGSKWTGDRTGAYAYQNHNPDWFKVDWLSTGAIAVSDGFATFTAKPSTHTLENGKQAWDTGLLTTEFTQSGFMVKTGDYVETRVKLPTVAGAWPALWTWKEGGNEIDTFEYHPDSPNVLELTNHVNRALKHHSDADVIAPDSWVTVGTRYGADSVEWYLDGERVLSDGTGVGRHWSAHLIMNLSVSDGSHHPAPSGSTPITFAADYIRVYR